MASILWLPIVFGSSALYLFFIARCLPAHNNDDSNSQLQFPSDMEELKALAALLSQYTHDHLIYVLLLFCSAYIFKQTFAISGSVFLNLLAGALFGIRYGFPLVCVLTAMGATNCYLLSRFFGKQHVIKHFSARIEPIQKQMEENRESLFLFILSLRLFPMAPNWLMNMAAPILGVPIHLFFISVLIGLMPYNFLCVEAGCMLKEIRSTSDILTLSVMLKMFAAAAVTFIPGAVVKYYQKNKSKVVKAE